MKRIERIIMHLLTIIEGRKIVPWGVGAPCVSKEA